MELAGGIVLTEHGGCARRHLRPLVVRVRGLRVAGYSDPFERRASERFRARGEPRPDAEQREEFRDWLRPLIGHVDVVMVHEPQLAEDAAEELAGSRPQAAGPPRRPYAHIELRSSQLVELNGTVGGGAPETEEPALRPGRAHPRAWAASSRSRPTWLR